MRILLVLLMTAASGFAQDHDRLFVLNKSGDTLSIVNAVSMSVERTVPTGRNPHEMAIAPNGMKAYIANVGDNTVSVLDLKTFAVTKQIRNPDFQYPHGIVFTPDSRRALVTNERSKKIVLLDAATDEVIRSIDTDQAGTHMALIDKAGAWAYFTNRESNTVSFMSIKDYRIMANVPVGQGGEGFALSPNEKEIWVADRTGNTVSVIDLASRRVVATLPIGQRPNRVTFTPDGKHVLIPIASGEVNVFDAATRQNIRKVQAGATPGGIVPSPDGKRVFVACGDANEIHVIDTERWTVAARIAVGSGPDGVAFKAR